MEVKEHKNEMIMIFPQKKQKPKGPSENKLILQNHCIKSGTEEKQALIF